MDLISGDCPIHVARETHRQTGRERERTRKMFWVHCQLRAVPSVLHLFPCTGFHLFLMSEWREVVNRRLHRHERNSRGKQAMAGQRQPEWQHAKCYTRSFLSKSGCRGCGKEKDAEGLVCRREWSDCAMAAPEWRRDDLWRPPQECIRVLECKVLKEEAEMKQAQPVGQRVDQARARFRRAVEAGEKAQDAMLKARANF